MLLLHLILMGVLASLTCAADIEAQPIVADSCPKEDKPYEVVLVASNSTCSVYYLCHQGQAIKQRCIRDLHFNPKTGRCDYRDNVACSLDSSEPELCPPGSTKTYAIEGYCHIYYVCYRGDLKLASCSYGAKYNAAVGGCAFRGQCPPENGISLDRPKRPRSMRLS